MENIERIKQLLLTLSESELQEIETFLQEHIHKKPYWYYYWRTSDQAKLKSRYWGKKEPPV